MVPTYASRTCNCISESSMSMTKFIELLLICNMAFPCLSFICNKEQLLSCNLISKMNGFKLTLLLLIVWLGCYLTENHQMFFNGIKFCLVEQLNDANYVMQNCKCLTCWKIKNSASFNMRNTIYYFSCRRKFEDYIVNI